MNTQQQRYANLKRQYHDEPPTYELGHKWTKQSASEKQIAFINALAGFLSIKIVTDLSTLTRGQMSTVIDQLQQAKLSGGVNGQHRHLYYSELRYRLPEFQFTAEIVG